MNTRFVTFGEAMKRCRKCSQPRALTMFPQDRTKPDGRWHTCKFCNRQYWRERGKLLRAIRRAATHHGPTLTGVRNLRRYHRKDREPFASLPPELRPVAQKLFDKYAYRHRHRLTPTLYACLYACAASNAQRVGDRSWARRLWNKKGQYRKLRRQEEERTKQDELRSRGPTIRFYPGDLTGI